jgi:CRISPR-associated protein Cmr6
MAKSTGATLFEAKTDWRFITGLGRKGPLEVGFTFHRIYGFPIIPGSGLKGLARAWAYFALQEAGPSTKPEEEPDFIAVFGHDPGDNETAGGAIFFDAIPLDVPALDLDVMTPHFPDYYQSESKPPSDDQNPVPIPFLTVKPGVRFAFAIGWRGKPNPKAHRLATEWLQKGLEQLGAGAKTAAGYGYFADFQEGKEAPVTVTGERALSEEIPSQPADPHQRLVDDFKYSLQALPVKDVAGQIAQFVDRWQQSQLPDEYRLEMARAILEKVESAGRTKKSQKKRWFQELQTFVAEHKGSKREG